ncbi:MAG: hypothetical protein AAF354_14910 [Pseudomonadota bacterium]
MAKPKLLNRQQRKNIRVVALFWICVLGAIGFVEGGSRLLWWLSGEYDPLAAWGVVALLFVAASFVAVWLAGRTHNTRAEARAEEE